MWNRKARTLWRGGIPSGENNGEKKGWSSRTVRGAASLAWVDWAKLSCTRGCDMKAFNDRSPHSRDLTRSRWPKSERAAAVSQDSLEKQSVETIVEWFVRDLLEYLKYVMTGLIFIWRYVPWPYTASVMATPSPRALHPLWSKLIHKKGGMYPGSCHAPMYLNWKREYMDIPLSWAPFFFFTTAHSG